MTMTAAAPASALPISIDAPVPVDGHWNVDGDAWPIGSMYSAAPAGALPAVLDGPQALDGSWFLDGQWLLAAAAMTPARTDPA